jgi:putative acetyltransferase
VREDTAVPPASVVGAELGLDSVLAIRRYLPHDAEATIEIFLRAIRDVASKDYTPDQVNAWAQVENHEGWARKRASRPTWVATVNGSPAGFSDLEPSGYLDMMFVHPQYQGVGVASLLLRTVEATAQNQGLRCLTTEASLTARPFFERRGFDVVASQEVQKRGQTLRNFLMERRLP